MSNTVLCQKRPNDENKSSAEINSSKKQPRLRKENNQSIVPPRVFEKFEMTKPTYGMVLNKFWLLPEYQEMSCLEECKSEDIGSKPTNFTGKSEVYKADNSVQNINLVISVSKDRKLNVFVPIFSWIFENEITDEAWPHVQHFFSHLLEPRGTTGLVRLVPFDMKIWNDLTKSHPNVISKICALELEIEFELHELEWVINFASRYCIAKTLKWTFKSVDEVESDCDQSDSGETVSDQSESGEPVLDQSDSGEPVSNQFDSGEPVSNQNDFSEIASYQSDSEESDPNWSDVNESSSDESDSDVSDSDENNLIPAKEKFDTIVGFIGSQGNNFGKLEINSPFSYNADGLATLIVQMFQNHDDPSKMIKEISSDHIDRREIKSTDGFPFCLDENKDIFKRVYKNQNSDYILEVTQSVTDYSRTIAFSVIEPTSH